MQIAALCYVKQSGFIAPEQSLSKTGAESGHMLKGKHILLVEDEYFIVQDMARVFAAAGAVVVGPAASVAESLRLLAATPALDGAVLDINLQGEMVFPLADALINRNVPFVFATGYDEDVIPSRFAGVTRYEKPVNPDQIVRALFRAA
jgi:CheY-like chemotaxis protein